MKTSRIFSNFQISIQYWNPRFRLFPCLLLSWLCGLGTAAELEDLVAKTLARHPRVQAAAQKLAQVEARNLGIEAFFDPALDVRGGAATRGRAVPGTSMSSGWRDESVGLEAGIEMPLADGLYVGAGMGNYYLSGTDQGRSSGGLTQTGVYIAVPLLRDRGFALYDARTRAAAAEAGAVWAQWLQAVQELRRDIELSYWNLQLARARIAVTEDALKRAETLLEQTLAYIESGAKPSFHQYTAAYEAALRREELEAARQQEKVAQIALQEVVAAVEHEPVPAAVELIQLAAEMAAAPTVTLDEVLPRRGEYLEWLSLREAELARLTEALEERRDSLTLQGSLTWQDGGANSAKRDGAEISLVWTRPLGFTKERAEIAALRAGVRVYEEKIREQRLSIRRELENAQSARVSAKQRLTLATEAIARAGEAFAAETQRFQLGEGTSRQMVDAQKDLTAARSRQITLIGELLTAETNYRFATGIIETGPPVNLEKTP